MSNFMRDFADKSYLKSDLIPGQDKRNEHRRDQAIRRLGTKYLCHPVNRVKKQA